jgi:rubrerythrin
MQLSAVDRILEYAIGNEERAAAFYRYFAAEAPRESTRQIFLRFAAEEENHKAKLREIKASGQELAVEAEVAGLGLADKLPDDPLDLAANMDYGQVLALAIKAEKGAYMLYTRLADTASNAAWKSALRALAQEEARHSLQFEREYAELKQRGV